MPRRDPTSSTETGSRLTLIALLLGVLLSALDIAIVGPALPAIRSDFGLGPRELPWVLNVYILFALVSAPLLAAWSDQHGRRRVYLVSLGAFGTGSALVALAPSFGFLLVGRAVQAFGAGGLLPIASAVIADTFPPERRGRALGLIGAIFGIAFVLGPLLGGLLLRFSWRYLFVVNLPLVVTLVVIAATLLPAARAENPRAFDWPGAGALAVALGTLAWTANWIEPGAIVERLASAAGAVPLTLGVLAAGSFWLVEQRAGNPVMHPALLRSRQMRVVAALAIATGFVEASMVFLPVLAVETFGVEASTASFMLLPLVAALIVGSVLAGRLLDRIGPKPVIQTGMALTIVGLFLFGSLRPATTSFYGAGLCVGLGLASLLGAPLRYVALEEGGATRRGASQGLLTVALSGGRMLGASLIGGIAASGAGEVAGFRRGLLAVAVICSLSLVATVWLENRAAARPQTAEGHGERGGGAP